MTQADLPFDHPWRSSRLGALAWEWIHTPIGGQVVSDFIRLALHCKNHLNKTVGAKLLYERLRWDYQYSKPADQEYTLNNNFTKYVAMFAMERVPELRGYFELREKKNH